MRNYRLSLVLCLLTTLIIGVAAAACMEESQSYAWPVIHVHGPAPALSDAALVNTSEDRALLWPPTGDPAPIVYTSLADSAYTTNIISYGNVHPRRWLAVPAGEMYHLVWEETSGALRSALVHTNGDTVRGPVDLSAAIGSELVVLPTPGNQALVLWTTPGSEAQLASLVLDVDGRPGPITLHPVRRIQHLAAVRDTEQHVHLAWLTAPSPDTRAIQYHRTSGETLAVENSTTLYTLQLDQDEAIRSFAFGLDHTFGYVVSGTVNAEQPGEEQIEIVAFPLAQPQTISHSKLVLPRTIRVAETGIESALTTGHIAVLQPDAPRAALRWPSVAPGQHDALVLTAAIKQETMWQPGVAFFQDGTLRGYQIVAKLPADAGPPLLDIAASGDLTLTWMGLSEGNMQRYTAFTAGKGWSQAPVSRANLLPRTLAGIAVGVPLSLLWVILPTLVLLAAPANRWMPPLLCALYGAAKLHWPPDLFSQVPPLLASDALQSLGASWIVVGAVSGIMLLAGISAWLTAHRSPLWHIWITFVIVDLSLTWIVFGATLAP